MSATFNSPSRYAEALAFRAKDGSLIRELLHPNRHGNHNQSLAEATVAPGEETQLHRHRCTEEIYHILRGEGLMTLGNQSLLLIPGDSLCIPPGTPHRIRNTGGEPLVFLCCCSPAYRDQDTDLL